MRLPAPARGFATKAYSEPRAGRKGNLYGPRPQQPQISAEEQNRIYIRRIKKAERDERMDITMSLTPVKTYMGGFTRPRDVQSSNWWPGGRYLAKNKIYEPPEIHAYQNYTIYLLETRYPVKHGTGRADSVDHVVGRCAGGALPQVLQYLNNPLNQSLKKRLPSDLLNMLDNAKWPFLVPKPLRPTVWALSDDRPEFWRRLHNGSIGIDDALSEWARLEAAPKMRSEDSGSPDAPKTSTAASYTPPGEAEESEPYSSPTVAQEPIDLPESELVELPEQHQTNNPFMMASQPLLRLRGRYAKTLQDEPFFRPILAITLPSRPLADTVLRLSKAHPRGLPFYASIDPHDRKYGDSYGSRMRNMRISRMRSLALDTVRKLSGEGAGFIGMRLSPHDRGRGINGENLEDVLPLEKRMVSVAFGDWYDTSKDDYEWLEAESSDYREATQVQWLNQWGYLIDANGEVIPGQTEVADTGEGEEEEEEGEEDEEE